MWKEEVKKDKEKKKQMMRMEEKQAFKKGNFTNDCRKRLQINKQKEKDFKKKQ